MDSLGNVYVADTDNHRVQKFTSDGIFITKWGGTSNSDIGKFSGPMGVAVDDAGNVYVADYDNNYVTKFYLSAPANPVGGEIVPTNTLSVWLTHYGAATALLAIVTITLAIVVVTKKRKSR